MKTTAPPTEPPMSMTTDASVLGGGRCSAVAELPGSWPWPDSSLWPWPGSWWWGRFGWGRCGWVAVVTGSLRDGRGEVARVRGPQVGEVGR